MTDIIKLGNKLDMEKLKENGAKSGLEKRIVYSSQVLDFPGVNIVRVSMPVHEGRLVPLSIGDEYACCFYTTKGLYSSKTVVINRAKEGNLFIADMELKTPLKKIQRREYYRFKCHIPVKYRILSEKELVQYSKKELQLEEVKDYEWKNGVITDLSGGGIKFVASVQEQPASELQLVFNLYDGDESCYMLLNGYLITSYRSERNTKIYEHRVKFTKIEPKQREKIIGYIFEEERKNLSKEKGLS